MIATNPGRKPGVLHRHRHRSGTGTGTGSGTGIGTGSGTGTGSGGKTTTFGRRPGEYPGLAPGVSVYRIFAAKPPTR